MEVQQIAGDPHCHGRSSSTATSICVQDECSGYPFLCQKDCNCHELHQDHDVRHLTYLKQETMLKTHAVEGFLRVCDAINSLIAMGIIDIKTIRDDYDLIADQELLNLLEACKKLAQLLTQASHVIANTIHAMRKKTEQAVRIHKRIKRFNALSIKGRQLTDEPMEIIAKEFPHLTELYVCYNSLTDRSAHTMGHSLSSLTKLHIGNNNITDQGIRAITQKLELLMWLNIQDNPTNDESARSIARGLPKLNTLVIRTNNQTNEGVRSIAQALSRLLWLDIADNNLTGEGSGAILKGLPLIPSLVIWKNQLIPRSHMILRKGLPISSVYN